MSVNSHPPATLPVLLPGEHLLMAAYPADLELRVPATIQGPKRTEHAKGRLSVTDNRIIFIVGPSSTPSPSVASYDAPPSLTSLIVPYACLRSNTFNLPIFGANHLVLTFQPDSAPGIDPGLPDPGRDGSIEAKLVIGDGAGHAVWKRIEGEREAWAQRRREEDQLPVYTPRNT